MTRTPGSRLGLASRLRPFASGAGLLRRTVVLAFANGASKLLIIGVELFLAVSVGTAVLGLFAICQSLLLVVGGLALVGTDYGAIRFLAIYQEERDPRRVRHLVLAAWAVAIACSSILALGLIVGREWLATSVLDKPELVTALLWVALALPFEAFNQSSGAIFRGLRREHHYVVSTDLLRNLLLLGAVLVWADGRSDITHLAQLLFLGTLLGTVHAIVVLARSVLTPTSEEVSSFSFSNVARELLAFSTVLLLWNVLLNVSARAQILLASAFLSPTEVGVFSIFYRALLVLTFVQSIVNNTASVEFTRLHHRNELHEIQLLYRRVSIAMSIVVAALLLPVLADVQAVLGWISPAVAAAAPLAIPLLIAQGVNVATGPMGNLLIACGERRAVLLLSLFAAITAVGLYFVLASSHGLAGAVTAEVITIVALTAVRLVVGRIRLGIRGVSMPLLYIGVAVVVLALLARLVGMATHAAFGVDLSALVAVVLGVLSGIPALSVMASRARRSTPRAGESAEHQRAPRQEALTSLRNERR